MNIKRIKIILCIVLFASVLSGRAVFGDSFNTDDDVFDQDQEYKIFFSGTEEYSNAIENVQILGFKEIAGRLFLVVRAKGFSITKDKGYVLFDSISAILPDREIKIHRIKNSINP